MTDIRTLTSQLHEIAWSAVRGPAADPWAGASGTRRERRSGAIQLLAIYSQLSRVLQRRIDLTIRDALEAGSDYGEIAAACGVTRQAIRQRWMRRSAPSRWFDVRRESPGPHDPAGARPPGRALGLAAPVVLAGGPYDGHRVRTAPAEVLRFQADRPPSAPSGAALLLACYIPSPDDAAVYIFAGVEPDHWRMHATGRPLPPGAGPAKKRVYELAAELGVDSRVVMAKLGEMGEFIRSASSTVELRAAHELRVQFTMDSQRNSGQRPS